jgi:hypothetical protein
MRQFEGGRLVLAAGIFVFLAVKLLLVVGQTAVMGMPRLGDDAFTHLWRATQIERVGFTGALRGDGDVAYRASADIGELCRDDAQATQATHALCARLADNTAGADVKAGASLLLSAALQTGLPWKWAYALFESLIVIILGLSLAYFLARLFGLAAAGLGLLLLAFMTLLPPQGLHQFVGTTLAVALSLALWGAVIRRNSPALYAAAAVCAGVSSFVHPVALIYGGGLALLALYAFRQAMTPLRFAVIAAAGVVILMTLLSFPNPVRTVLDDALSANLWHVAGENLAALPARLSTFAIQNAGIVAAIVIGVLFRHRLADGWVRAVAAVFFLLLFASLFYRTDFFTFAMPLDLFARIFIGLTVVGCGFLGAILVNLWHDGSPARRLAAVVAVPLLLLPSIPSWQATLYENVNGRGEVVDEASLKAAIDSFAADTAFAFGELEISPTAVFAAGGGDHHALPLPSLSPDKRREALEQWPPGALIIPNYHVLNTLAVAGSHSLERRRYGFPAGLVDLVAVSTSDTPITLLHIRVENESDRPAVIGPIRYTINSGQSQILSNLTVPANFAGWLPVKVGAPARRVTLSLPPSNVWMTGFAVNDPPRDGIGWPWASQATVTWQRRDLPRGKNTMALTFSVPRLLAYWNPPSLGPLAIPNLRSVINDESGLVFVAIDHPPKPRRD